jgi:5-methylcytosine-specific restriction protein A
MTRPNVSICSKCRQTYYVPDGCPRCKAEVFEYMKGATRSKGWYHTKEWKNLRRKIISSHPLCQAGCGRSSKVVDHIIAHKGNYEMFFTHSNLQALCKACHDRKTVKEMFGGNHG